MLKRLLDGDRPSLLVRWKALNGRTYDYCLQRPIATSCRRLAFALNYTLPSLHDPALDAIMVDSDPAHSTTSIRTRPLHTSGSLVPSIDVDSSILQRSFPLFVDDECVISSLWMHLAAALDVSRNVSPGDGSTCTCPVSAVLQHVRPCTHHLASPAAPLLMTLVYLLTWLEAPPNISDHIVRVLVASTRYNATSYAHLAALQSFIDPTQRHMIRIVDATFRASRALAWTVPMPVFGTSLLVENVHEHRGDDLLQCVVKAHGTTHPLGSARANGDIGHFADELTCEFWGNREPLQVFALDAIDYDCAAADACSCVHITEATMVRQRDDGQWKLSFGILRDMRYVDTVIGAEAAVEAMTLRSRSHRLSLSWYIRNGSLHVDTSLLVRGGYAAERPIITYTLGVVNVIADASFEMNGAVELADCAEHSVALCIKQAKVFPRSVARRVGAHVTQTTTRDYGHYTRFEESFACDLSRLRGGNDPDSIIRYPPRQFVVHGSVSFVHTNIPLAEYQ